MTWIPDTDFLIEVAAGNVPDHSILEAFGERENVGTTTAGEDITRMNDLSPAPTSHTMIPTPSAAGEQMTIVSESGNDSAAGTGARTVELHYLDATGNPQKETLTMLGTTGVNTVATNIRFVQYIHVLTVGSLGVADGNIKIAKTGTVGLVYSMIAAGGNMALLPHRMVPFGKKMIILGWHASEAQGKRGAFRLRSTDNEGIIVTGVFNFKDSAYLNQTTFVNNQLHTQVPALTIVKVSGWANVAGGEVSTGWRGLVMPA